MKDDVIKKEIENLFNELERLSKFHDEIMDTDVREAIHLTLNKFFVWGEKPEQLPISYGMFTLEGDLALSRAIEKFFSSLCDSSQFEEVEVGGDRLAILQDPQITTTDGRKYDNFIGHVDRPLPPDDLPEDLFEPGEYDE